MKALFDSHKKDALPDEQASVLNEIKAGYESYLTNRENENAQRAKLALLAKQIGLNVAKLSNEEISVLMKALQDSDLYKKAQRRK
jgi:hypothetical protein